jgi:shikimate kinase
VGRALEEKTGLPLHDTDMIVSAWFGLPIREIFKQHGEEQFRESETEALAKLGDGPAIIVTGGGTVLRPENVTIIRGLGVVVNLTADEETLFERVSRRATRPLLQTENPRETLRELLRVREPLYRQAADLTLDTSGVTHDEVAEAVLRGAESLQRNAS